MAGFASGALGGLGGGAGICTGWSRNGHGMVTRGMHTGYPHRVQCCSAKEGVKTRGLNWTAWKESGKAAANLSNPSNPSIAASADFDRNGMICNTTA